MHQPLISIITAVRNGRAHIEQTIESVLKQDFPEIEHIIIDGASTDGTQDVIRKYEKRIAYFISETDRGISDAFNKGVLASRGSALLFLGSDDYLHDSTVLSQVACAMKVLKKPYFFYGDVNYTYANGVKRIRQNYSFKKFCRYDCLPHQAMFLDRFFFDRYGLFDLNYRYAMDYEHTARFIREYQPEYVDILISGMRRSGVSSQPLQAHGEMDRIRLKHGLANPLDLVLSNSVLHAKILAAKLFKLNW